MNKVSISLKGPICINSLNEDSLRELVENMVGTLVGNLPVTSTGGIEVEYIFDSSGNFDGSYAKINNKKILLTPGVTGKMLTVFQGPPSANNPGPGWKVEVELTREFLQGGPDETTFKVFYASREPVLNNF